MRRHSFIAGLLLVPTVLGASSARAGHLRVAMLALSPDIDPYLSPQLNVDDLSWFYADGFVGAGPHGPIPLAIQRIPSVLDGSISDGGKTIEYALREGIRWHDGSPLTAHDISGAYRRVADSPWSSSRPYNLVSGIEVIDDLRFRVHLSRPDPAFPLSFFSAYGSPGLPLIRKGDVPMGTGPFKISRLDKATGQIELVPWEHSARRRPNAAGITLETMGDPNTVAITVVSGDSDVALYVPHQIIEANHIRYASNVQGVVYLLANTRGALGERRLRDAVWSALDVDAIRRQVYGKWGEPAASILSPNVAAAAINLRPRYDPAKAKAELSRLSLRDTHLTVVSPPLDGARVALLIQAQLQSVGITVSLQRYGVREYFALDGPLRSGRFDIALSGEAQTIDPDLAASLSCSSLPPAGGNFGRICDRVLDSDIAAGDTLAAMNELRAQEFIDPLAQIVNCIGLGSRVKNFRVQNYVPITYYCNEWSLK